MKKLLVVLMTVVVLCSALIACSKKEQKPPVTTESISTIVTDKAKIKEGEALEFIRNAYTPEELGLDKTDKNYQFMIASSGVEIDGGEYVKVVANVPTKNDTTSADGKPTFTMETLGEYFISFDGETVLIKDMSTGEFSELENRYDDFKADQKKANK